MGEKTRMLLCTVPPNTGPGDRALGVPDRGEALAELVPELL